MSVTPGSRAEARQDGDIDFFAAEADDLDRVVAVPQAFDNQWLAGGLLGELMSARRPGDAAVERRRGEYVRGEYLRALVNTGQVVINRAFLYNNPAIYRDYARPAAGREDFKKLLGDGVVIPYLVAEPSPGAAPAFTRDAAGWEAWSQVIRESACTCLRLSWESDEQNAIQARRLLGTPFGQFLKTIDDLEAPLLAADLGLTPTEAEGLPERLRDVAVWARRRSEAGEPVNREDVYRAFVVEDGTEPSDRRYDPGKPFAAAIKQIADLRYNANLPDALESYLLTPGDSLRRRALQEWRDNRRGTGIADADRLVRVVANLRFDQVSEVLGAPAAFEQLTLGGIAELRSTPAWRRYHAVLRDFLNQPTLETFGDPGHGAEAVTLAYREVIKQAGAIAARRSAAAISRRWDPVIEITVEFAGALLSVFYNTDGAGSMGFHLARDLAPGVATRTARAVFHLAIGRVTRSRARSRVDNSLRVLETRLDHGRRDWADFLAALRTSGIRELGELPGQDAAAMEKGAEE